MRRLRIATCIGLALSALATVGCRGAAPSPTPERSGLEFPGPILTGISDNQAQHPDRRVPQYEKLEITFQIEDTAAQNFQLPSDPDPPPGIDPAYAKPQGITVDALLTPRQLADGLHPAGLLLPGFRAGPHRWADLAVSDRPMGLEGALFSAPAR